jgi:hypothetical protein
VNIVEEQKYTPAETLEGLQQCRRQQFRRSTCADAQKAFDLRLQRDARFSRRGDNVAQPVGPLAFGAVRAQPAAHAPARPETPIPLREQSALAVPGCGRYHGQSGVFDIDEPRHQGRPIQYLNLVDRR